MKENEVKILEIDYKRVQRKLKSMGAKKVFEGPMVATYFDFKRKKLGRWGKILRLRQKGKKFELTYKKKHKNQKVKSVDEYEIAILDAPTLLKILEGIGLRQTKTLKKYRISYSLGKMHYEIDTFRGIPPFLEIESPTIAQLHKAVKQLGYTAEDAKPWSSADVLRHYGKL